MSKSYEKSPLVSVLIPVYRAGKYIREAIESVLKQSVKDLEIIIVNDGSDDDSMEHASAFPEEYGGDCPVLSIDMPHLGQAHARNTALKAARGSWIFYLDADDVLTDNALELLLEGADEDREAGVICSMCRDFISPDLTEEEAAKLKIQDEPYRRMLSGCTLIRREVYDLVGEFDETLASSETAQWMLRMKDAGVKVHDIDGVTLLRRYHRNNFGRTGRQTQLKSYMDIIRQRRGLGKK